MSFYGIIDAMNNWLRPANDPSKIEGKAIGAVIEDAIDSPIQPSTVTAAGYTLVLDDRRAFKLMDRGTGQVVTVPANADVAFPEGTSVSFIQQGVGQVSFVGDGGVTVTTDEESLAATACIGAVCTLFQIAPDEWHLFGKLEAA